MRQADAVALMRKRAVLLAQISTERAALAQQAGQLRPAAQMVDKARAGVRYVKSHRAILLLPIAILSIWRPRRILSMVASGLGFWRLFQRGRQLIR